MRKTFAGRKGARRRVRFRISVSPQLLFCILWLGFLVSLPAGDALIWEIRHPEHPGVVFLAGSVHLGHADMYPLDRVYDESLAKADYLGFEIASPDLIKAAVFMLKRGMYPAKGKKNLRTVLGETDFQSLCGMIQSVRPDSLARMKPWVVTTLLEAEKAKALGFTEAAGMEKVFHQAAGGRPERSLETEEEQLEPVSDPALEKELVADIRKNIVSEEKLTGEIRGTVPAIREGETGLLLQSMEEMRRDSPRVHRNLVLDRNRKMAARLFEMLKEKETGFILVGAGHCLGPESMLECLERTGCTAVRLKFTGVPGELKPKRMEK